MVGLSKAVHSAFFYSLSAEMRIFCLSEYLSKDLLQRRQGDQKLSLGFLCCFKPEESKEEEMLWASAAISNTKMSSRV